MVTPSSGRKLAKNEWRQMTSPSDIHIAYFTHNKGEKANSHGVTEVVFILTVGLSDGVK
jgi:hypothetical protein